MNILPDEQQPLLTPTAQDAEHDPIVKQSDIPLNFEDGDPQNPREWSTQYKWCIVLLLASMAFTITFTCMSVVPVANRISSDLSGHVESSSSESALLVTIWELGEAAGPLFIAPLSELFGRYPVLNVCNITFVLSTLLAATSHNTGTFIAARMLTGLSVAVSVLSPAVIGDMFESESRGSAMSLLMLAPLLGGAIGPSISGAIAQTLGWRQVLFFAAGLAACCELLFLTCFRETYKVSILKKKAAKIRHESGERPQDAGGKSKHENLLKLWHSLTRPFAVLFGSRVLLLLSLFGSVSFSYFYIMSVTLSSILEGVYGFTPAQMGLAFTAFSFGSTVGVLLCHFCLDQIYIYLRERNNAKGIPEYRLPLIILGAILFPFSVVAYGWVAQLHLSVPLLLTSVAVQGAMLLVIIIPISAYVVDACGVYSASAMTGVIVTRCLMSTFLPLAVGPLTERMGYGLGFTCLGTLGIVLAAFPLLILRYGEMWRHRSEFTRDA